MATPPRIAINGRFLSRPITGVERYAHALMQALDHDHDTYGPAGWIKGHLWEQWILPFRIGSGQLLICPANTGPLTVRNQVLVVHDLAFWHHPEWFSRSFATWYRWLLPRLVERVRHIITPSASTRQDLIRTLNVPENKATVVPPFVQGITSTGTPTGVDRPYYLFVGSLDPRKGLDRALQWYAGLRDPQFSFVLVGRAGRAFAPVHKPYTSNVMHLADVDDNRLASLYANAIALIQPSRFEGFGLPVLEAMHLGCPVIASDLAVFREQFGSAPLFADIGGTRSMMDAMVAVANIDERARIVAAGRERAASFTREHTAAALRVVLDPIIRS